MSDQPIETVDVIASTVPGAPGTKDWFTAQNNDYGIEANPASANYGLLKLVRSKVAGVPARRKFIATCPINIVQWGKDEHGSEYVTLRFTVRDEEQLIMLPRREVFNGEVGLTQLIDRGAGVIRANWSEVQNFLLLQYRASFKQMPRVPVFTKAGWSDDFTTYVSGERTWGVPGEVICDGNDRMRAALTSKGSYDEWRKCTWSVLQGSSGRQQWTADPAVVFDKHAAESSVALGFVGPLVKLIGERSLMDSRWSKTKDGKSAAQSLAASATGNPDRMKVTAESSLAFMEIYFRWQRDGFTFIDDTAMCADIKTLKNLGYMFVNGTTKGRSSADSTAQQQGDWKGCASVSGETPIMQKMSQEGSQTRTFETNVKPFPTEELAAAVHKCLENHYGWALEVYINKLLADYANTAEGRCLLREVFLGLLPDIAEKVTEKVKQAGLMGLAVWLMYEYVFDVPEAEARVWAVAMAKELLRHSQAGAEDSADMADRSYDLISGWVFQNEVRFDRDAEPTMGRLGVWLAKEPNVVAIIPTELEKFAREQEFNLKQVMTALSADGRLKVEARADGKKTLFKQAKLPAGKVKVLAPDGKSTIEKVMGGNQKCYCLVMPAREVM